MNPDLHREIRHCTSDRLTHTHTHVALLFNHPSMIRGRRQLFAVAHPVWMLMRMPLQSELLMDEDSDTNLIYSWPPFLLYPESTGVCLRVQDSHRISKASLIAWGWVCTLSQSSNLILQRNAQPYARISIAQGILKFTYFTDDQIR